MEFKEFTSKITNTNYGLELSEYENICDLPSISRGFNIIGYEEMCKKLNYWEVREEKCIIELPSLIENILIKYPCLYLGGSAAGIDTGLTDYDLFAIGEFPHVSELDAHLNWESYYAYTYYVPVHKLKIQIIKILYANVEAFMANVDLNICRRLYRPGIRWVSDLYDLEGDMMCCNPFNNSSTYGMRIDKHRCKRETIFQNFTCENKYGTYDGTEYSLSYFLIARCVINQLPPMWCIRKKMKDFEHWDIDWKDLFTECDGQIILRGKIYKKTPDFEGVAKRIMRNEFGEILEHFKKIKFVKTYVGSFFKEPTPPLKDKSNYKSLMLVLFKTYKFPKYIKYIIAYWYFRLSIKN